MPESIATESFDLGTDRPAAARWSWQRISIAVVIAMLLGMAVRTYSFNHTYDLRSTINQRNAFYWGDRILRAAHPAPGPAAWGDLWRSYVTLYEANEAHPSEESHALDYAPLRLLVVGVWVNYLNIQYGPASEWQPEFARSFAAFSTLMELAASASMFALVAYWLGRTESHRGRSLSTRHFNRWEIAAAAAMLVWLNPASIVDSQVCPQSESWVMPFYLLAILFMTWQWFFRAGVLLGIGAMFKGQMLMIAPALILWPMFDRRWSSAVSIVLGAALAMGVIALPWLDHGSFAWARTGFAAHVKSNDVLRKGQSLNLSFALEKWFHLSLHQPLLSLRLFGHRMVLEVRSALTGLFAALLVLCARNLARQARSNDRYLLVSIAAPWAAMFFVLGQMDERYLVWAVCFSAGAIAVGRRPLLAHMMLTIAALAMMIEGRLITAAVPHHDLFRWLSRAHPLTAVLTTLGIAVLFMSRHAPSFILRRFRPPLV